MTEKYTRESIRGQLIHHPPHNHSDREIVMIDILCDIVDRIAYIEERLKLMKADKYYDLKPKD